MRRFASSAGQPRLLRLLQRPGGSRDICGPFQNAHRHRQQPGYQLPAARQLKEKAAIRRQDDQIKGRRGQQRRFHRKLGNQDRHGRFEGDLRPHLFSSVSVFLFVYHITRVQSRGFFKHPFRMSRQPPWMRGFPSRPPDA